MACWRVGLATATTGGDWPRARRRSALVNLRRAPPLRLPPFLSKYAIESVVIWNQRFFHEVDPRNPFFPVRRGWGEGECTGWPATQHSEKHGGDKSVEMKVVVEEGRHRSKEGADTPPRLTRNPSLTRTAAGLSSSFAFWSAAVAEAERAWGGGGRETDA
jgi:hypothetical protein